MDRILLDENNLMFVPQPAQKFIGDNNAANTAAEYDDGLSIHGDFLSLELFEERVPFCVLLK